MSIGSLWPLSWNHGGSVNSGNYQNPSLERPAGRSLPLLFFTPAGGDGHQCAAGDVSGSRCAEGHGTEKVIEAIHKRSGRIKASVVRSSWRPPLLLWRRAGQSGKKGRGTDRGGLTSLFADFLKVSDHDRKNCHLRHQRGFASVFGTPISGAIFGVEVLFAGAILYDVLLPSFVAAVTAYQVRRRWGSPIFYHPLELVRYSVRPFPGGHWGRGIFRIVLRLFNRVASKRQTTGLQNQTAQNGQSLNAVWPCRAGVYFSKQFLGLGIPTLQATWRERPCRGMRSS